MAMRFGRRDAHVNAQMRFMRQHFVTNHRCRSCGQCSLHNPRHAGRLRGPNKMRTGTTPSFILSKDWRTGSEPVPVLLGPLNKSRVWQTYSTVASRQHFCETIVAMGQQNDCKLNHAASLLASKSTYTQEFTDDSSVCRRMSHEGHVAFFRRESGFHWRKTWSPVTSGVNYVSETKIHWQRSRLPVARVT